MREKLRPFGAVLGFGVGAFLSSNQSTRVGVFANNPSIFNLGIVDFG
jgi:hypothetical protein